MSVLSVLSVLSLCASFGVVFDLSGLVIYRFCIPLLEYIRGPSAKSLGEDESEKQATKKVLCVPDCSPGSPTWSWHIFHFRIFGLLSGVL